MRETSYEERAREERAPLQYKLFKGMTGKFGALRLNLKKAWSNQSIQKADGVVFMEMAPAIDKNLYDWQNQKMIMALSVNDIGKVIMYLRNPKHSMFKDKEDPSKRKLVLFHDKGAGTNNKLKQTKTLTIEIPEGKDNFFFTMYQKEQGNNITATVTVSPDEAIVMGTLLQSAIPSLLAW